MKYMLRRLLIGGLLLFSLWYQVPFIYGQSSPANAPGKSAPSAKALANKPIEGSLTLGGKTYPLASVAIYETTVFDQPAINVLASNKAIPLDKLKAAIAKDGTDDSFMFWESNVKVTFNADGKPMFVNSWADNHSSSISGGSITGELKIDNGIARGKFSSSSDDSNSLKCEFTFNAPVILKPAAKKIASSGEGDKKSTAESSDEPRAKARPTISIYKLPLPKDATNIEYKELVEQLKFASKASVSSLAKSFGDQLATAGWKKSDSDLVTPKSAILNRKQGQAELTIFIKPTDSGSTVLLMTEGLSWEKPSEASPTSAP